MFTEYRKRKNVIHGYVKKPLDLCRMKVHGQHPVHAGLAYKICHQFGGYGHTPFILPVLSGISVVGYHCRNPGSRGPLGTVNEHQKLHQVLVNRRTQRLYYENIRTPYILIHLQVYLAVGKAAYIGIPQRDIQIFTYPTGQIRIRITGKYLQIV